MIKKLKEIVLKTLRKTRVLRFLKFDFRLKFNGKNIRIPLINGMGYSNIFLKPQWIDTLIPKFCTDDNETFIDVGVNIGQTLIKLKTVNKHINYIGFEPNIVCCFYVDCLIKRNGFRNCQVVSLALSDKIQKLVLERNEDTDSKASIVQNLRPNFFTHKNTVFGIDYDSLDINRKVCFIKIDVEGAELETLKGMRNMIMRDKPIITCEILDSFSSEVFDFTLKRANLLIEFLIEINYVIIQLEQNSTYDKINSFNQISKISIKQWSIESYKYNDYIFVPVGRLNEVNLILKSLIE